MTITPAAATSHLKRNQAKKVMNPQGVGLSIKDLVILSQANAEINNLKKH